MPNTSRELRKLGEKQFIEKVTDDEDRRKQYIRLSEKGAAMMGEAFQRIESRFMNHMNKVSEEELREIERALDLLHSKVFYWRIMNSEGNITYNSTQSIQYKVIHIEGAHKQKQLGHFKAQA